MNDFGQRIAQLPPKRLALLALQLHNRVQEFERLRAEPIAIVGMACRFPGARTPAEYWQLLRDGKDQITEVPPERWDLNAYYDPDPEAPGKMYTRYGGFLDQIDGFDPQFFHISPREALSMDPQQRLLLEVCWEALENAGLAVDRLMGSATGVFMGTSGSNYSEGASLGDPDRINAYTGTGNISSVLAGRISYILGLHGPSLPVDTACSSSLVAVHLACQSLRSGESDLALAGGVNLLVAPESTVYFCKVRALAPDGRCKTFDAAANGYGRGEGCGVLVLKRLADARAQGDTVLAVIRGSAVNHGGRSSGLIVPNKVAQEAVIRAALANATLKPDDLQFVEAQGTGTALGDPVEVLALGAVFGERLADQPLLIGTAKANIGHLEAAAGVAGLIKAVAALQHAQVPPQLHFSRPNPYIPWERLPLRVPTALTAWPETPGPRRCGVSAFGFSGTNAHVILEEAPVVETRFLPETGFLTPERPWHLLCLSAASEPALVELANRWVEFLQSDAAVFADVCHTALVGRTHLADRLALPARSAAAAREMLADFAAGRPVAGLHQGQLPSAARPPRVAFLFAGHEAAYAGMGRHLYQAQPLFRETLNQCAELLRTLLPFPLQEILFPPPGSNGASPLAQARFAAPALFALQYALGHLWQAWGVEPAALLGQGTGEIAAACLAGVFSLEDGLRLAAAVDDPARVAGQVAYRLPRLGIVSGVTGRLETAALTRPEYWAKAIQSVNLADAVKTLAAREYDVFVEIGPAIPERQAEGLGALRPDAEDWCVLLDALAQLYVRGVPIDGAGFDEGYARGRVVLPNYPFQRRRYWNDKPPAPEAPPAVNGNGHAPPARNGIIHANGNGKNGHHDAGDIHQQLAGAPAGKRQALLTEHLRQEVARALHVDEPTAVDVRRPIMDLGLDSMMLVDLRGKLEALHGQAISPTLLIENPSIMALAAYLAGQPTDGAAAPGELEQVEHLPDAQAEMLLVRYKQASCPLVRQRLESLSPAKRELLLLRLAHANGEPAPSPVAECEPDLEAESLLDPAIRRPAGEPAPADPTAVLLTGATGFLGAHLLHELLTRTQAVVYCLVRAADLDMARARIEDCLSTYDLNSSPVRERVIPLIGDLDRPRLGLAERQVEELGERIDAFYHCGAMVHFLQSYGQLRQANVGGTIEALRLASRGRPKRFHFVSSISVYAALENFLAERILEDTPLQHGAGLPNGYARTKWVTDRLTSAARERGFETCIYRPGLIAGHSQTGHCKLDDLLPRLIKGCVQAGCAPVLEGVPVDFTPVDYVSRAIFELSRQPRSVGKAFVLLHPASLLWNDLIDEVRAFGYPLRPVAYPEWVGKLNEAPDNELRPLQVFYDNDLAGGFRLPPLDTQNTREGLPAEVACPPMRELLRTYLHYFVRCGYLPPPRA